MTELKELPENYTATRLALQSVAEHVLSAARHASTGRIGLRVLPGGFGTPPFEADGSVVQVRVDGLDLVVERDDDVDRQALTTVAAAAGHASIEPGAPSEVFTPSTALVPDDALELDPDAVRVLVTWIDLGQRALEVIRLSLKEAEPSDVELWPEHFDVAFVADEVNFGASPGDEDHDEPYLYVGPWKPPEGPFWNESFGASRRWSEIAHVGDAVAFYREALAAL